MNTPTMQAWWIAATVRAALLLVLPALLIGVLFLSPGSPLRPYAGYAGGAWVALACWVVASTLPRYRYRLAHPPVMPSRPDGAVKLPR